MLKNIHWLILIGIYLSFFIWYTNLSGPVTADEINEYLLKGSEDFKTEEEYEIAYEKWKKDFDKSYKEWKRLYDPDDEYE